MFNADNKLMLKMWSKNPHLGTRLFTKNGGGKTEKNYIKNTYAIKSNINSPDHECNSKLT